MKQFAIAACFAIGLNGLLAPAATLQNKPKPPKSARVYVFDCGLLTLNSPANFGFTKEEVGEKVVLAVPCYLIVHPKGTLMWDTGVVPDAQVDGNTHGISLATKTLRSQMAEIGYAPEDIKYLALSHLHADHTANANDFAGSTWLVHKTERDAMFGGPRVPGSFAPATFAKLKDAKTVFLTEKDYDVFGDGTVVIKYAPGHSPGHQILFLKLKESGPVLMVGDLFHMPQEIAMHRAPAVEFNKEQGAASRAMVLDFLQQTGARLWIEHDFATFVTLRKSPAYYQ
jgi:N-acyl homoserine lactone hydrolase